VLHEPDAIVSSEREVLTATPTVTPRSGRPDDALIIFDWDDTLLCSSALRLQQVPQSKLKVLSLTVEWTLRMAMQLGEVMIVTNGTESWVDESCRRFLPGLLPLLGHRHLHVRSARHCYERAYPGDKYAWKRETFKDILGPRHKATNLVVFGDSFSEIYAAHDALHCMVDSSLVKTVKFTEQPSVNELIGQLRCASQEMASLVAQDDHTHSTLVRLPSSWSVSESGWRLSDVILHYDAEAHKPISGLIGGLMPDAGDADTALGKGLLRPVLGARARAASRGGR
jgi:hypothetical protein